MTPAERIKPITYLKSNAADVTKESSSNREPINITQDGEAERVVMDTFEFERQRETIALLKAGRNLPMEGSVMLKPTLRRWTTEADLRSSRSEKRGLIHVQAFDFFNECRATYPKRWS